MPALEITIDDPTNALSPPDTAPLIEMTRWCLDRFANYSKDNGDLIWYLSDADFDVFRRSVERAEAEF